MYDNISYWCSIAVFKSLIGALQLTSIYKYFCCINLLKQMWFRALMSAPLYKGEEGIPSSTRNSESACSTFCALISYFYHIFFCANKAYFFDAFSSGFFQFFFTKQGIANTIPNLLSDFGLILCGLSKAQIAMHCNPNDDRYSVF